MTTKTEDTRTRLAVAHRRASLWATDVKRLRKRAGKAGRGLDGYDAVNRELVEATDVFAETNWGDLTLHDLAAAGRRIARLADQLDAAGRIPSAEQGWKEADLQLKEAREADRRAEAREFDEAHAQGLHDEAPREGCPECDRGKNGHAR
jgi:hypothetical protein